jgi:hypothetical protein
MPGETSSAEQWRLREVLVRIGFDSTKFCLVVQDRDCLVRTPNSAASEGLFLAAQTDCNGS